MAGFKVILDDLGIETASASCYYSNIIFSDTKGKFRKYGAIGVTPISVDSTTSGTLKGAVSLTLKVLHFEGYKPLVEKAIL